MRLGSHLGYIQIYGKGQHNFDKVFAPTCFTLFEINLNEELYFDDEVRIAESSIPSNRGTNGFMCHLNYYGSGHKSEYSRKTVLLSKTALVRAYGADYSLNYENLEYTEK